MNEVSQNSRRVAKNTLLLYVRMLLMMFIGLFTSRIVLRCLGIEDVGVFNAVAGVVTMFTLLSNSIAQAISRFMTYALGQGDSARLSKVFSTSVAIQLILSVLLVILVETLGLWYLHCKMSIPEGREIAAFWVLQCSLVILIVQLFSIPFNAVIIAHERMNAFAYISVLEAVLKLGVGLSLFITPFDPLITYAVLMTLTAFIVRFTYAIYSKRNFAESRSGLHFHKDVLKEMGAFSGWNFFGSSAYIINTQGINQLVNVFFGVTLNAARGYAVQVESIIKQFVSNFLTALNPQITKSYASGDKKYCFSLVEKGSRLTFLILIAFSIPVIIEAPYLLRVWLGTVPVQTELFVRLILIGTMADLVFNPLLTLELATGDIKRYYIITGLISYLALPISWILFHFGAQAYVTYIVFIAVYIVVDAAKLMILRRQVGLPALSLLCSAVLRPLLVAIIAAVPALALWRIMPQGFWRLVCVGALSTVLVCFASWFVALTQGEKDFVKNWLRRKALGLLDRSSSHLPDKLYLRLKFPLMLGYPLSLKAPKTFNEKLNWMKLYDRNPLYTKLVDKADVKDYVRNAIGDEYVIETLGVWSNFDAIDFDSLPDQFVLKCTHDSGSVIICRDKSSFDKEAARAQLSEALKKNFYMVDREWPYKDVKPRIIAEKYIESADADIPDYKFFCFNGEPRIMFVATERFASSETKFDFFDMDYNHLPLLSGHPCAEHTPERPEHFEQMKELCRILSKDMTQVRIDFYDVAGKLYFGEFTFSHWGGMMRFEPKEWDLRLGQMIDLGKKRGENE